MILRFGCALCALALAAGCVSGPVRYKTLGYRTYATREMTRRAHPVLKVPAAVGGVVADAAVVVLDTVATPFVSVPIAFENMGPCPQPTTRKNIGVKIITAPIWFTLSYPLTCGMMPFIEKQYYREWFGAEAETFKTEKSNKTN